jgi:hypothetical protein
MSEMAILQQLLAEAVKHAALSCTFKTQVHAERPGFAVRFNVYKHG